MNTYRSMAKLRYNGNTKQMKHLIQIATFLLWLPTFALAQCNAKSGEHQNETFERYATYIEPYIGQSKELVLEKTAEFFINTPYVAGTLDVHANEELVVNFEELDCVTYIETVIALTNAVEGGGLSLDIFTDELQKVRYRNGELTDYASRLHYTTDWIDDNVAMGILAPMEWEKECSLDTKKINFMSSHRSAYNALKEDDKMLDKIKDVEHALNQREGFYYLPKGEIEANRHRIPHMAMIAFTTTIKGLDTTHTGFAYHKGDKLTFIHASSLKKKVVIDDKTLHDYCASQKSCSGIIVMQVK